MEAAAFGVLGTLLGTVVGWWLTALSEEKRYRREEAGRWQSERRSVYAKFLADAMDCYMAFDPFKPEPPPDDVSRRVHLSHHEVDLLASDSVEAAAEQVIDSLARLRRLKLRGVNTGDLAQRKDHGEAKADFYDSKEAFLRAAKQELGITSSRRRPPFIPLTRLYGLPFASWRREAEGDSSGPDLTV